MCPVHPNVNGKKDKKEKKKKDKKEKSEQRKKYRNEQEKKVKKEKQLEIEIETPQKQSLLQRIRHRLSRKKTPDQKAMSDQKPGHAISLSEEKISNGRPNYKTTVCSVSVHYDMQKGGEVLSSTDTGAIDSEAQQIGQESLDEECKDNHFDSLKEENMLSNTEAGWSFKAQEEVYSEVEGDIESKTEQSAKDSLELIIENSERNINECIEGIYQEPPNAANDNSLEAGKDNKVYDQKPADDKEGESDWEIEF